jgi:AGZA family xanthine/uracil permease-like MFS transporter
MIWGAFTAKLIDRRFRAASLYLLVGALLTFFGLMHSVKIGGGMYLPWQITTPQVGPHPYSLSAAYLALATMIYLLSFTRAAREAAQEITD